MKVKTAKGEWAACFGLLGLLSLVGVATTVGYQKKAEAQTPQRTPEQIFIRACGRCHPDGGEDIGPDLHNKRKTVVEMSRQIRQGSKRMRAIPPTKLSDPDMATLMTYLRSIHAVR